ncbi:tryptophan halogenase family protein [Sphingomonas sp. TDK1]|uniref:tryptophan halogenase family protein n=1 Tax=Sphingomonas sp. TDK1 TaxID=453247 RepID=UPI0007D977E8|nr:tryptophan halogenase family protein [Sphingomonas sp. TDK1]OAN57590.1 tryptophan halogenase [Sphingomonas sp. TDK1]
MATAAPYRIVVAGGGTAGWMAAAALARFLGAGFTVTLVESDAIGTVGVGEATIPQIRMFNASLGIDEDAFVAATQASYKLAIEFVGWTKGGRYMHAFGDVGRDNGLLAFRHTWLRGLAEGVAEPLAAYALNNVAARANRMQRGPARTARVLPEMPYAFHFDAGLYARFLRDHAEAAGVVRHEGRIEAVSRNGEDGNVAALHLDGDRRIEGDLFLDCTGFHARLIGEAMGVGYQDWSHWLPCDRALAVPSARARDFTPYTRATAHDAGWQWRIPLQHRTGNGIVYSSRHLSDDEAAARLLSGLDEPALADPRPIRFHTGRRELAWAGNVIALGLASGFLEPLESTSIHMIQSAVERVLKLLPGGRAVTPLRDSYNRQAAHESERIRDFLILHYWANDRDERFWRERRETPLPDGLADKIALWREAGEIVREDSDLFSDVAWLQVLVGQGIIARRYHPLADQPPVAQIAEYLDLLAKLNAREVAQMLPHSDFVRAHGAAGAEIAA